MQPKSGSERKKHGVRGRWGQEGKKANSQWAEVMKRENVQREGRGEDGGSDWRKSHLEGMRRGDKSEERKGTDWHRDDSQMSGHGGGVM